MQNPEELSKLDENIIKDIVEVKLAVINLKKLVDALDTKLVEKLFNKGGEVVENKSDEYVIPKKCYATQEEVKSLLSGNTCTFDAFKGIR